MNKQSIQHVFNKTNKPSKYISCNICGKCMLKTSFWSHKKYICTNSTKIYRLKEFVDFTTIIRKHISTKLNDLRKRDMQKNCIFNLKFYDIIEMIKNHNGLCDGCGCEMLFINYKPWCLYQFSIDQIKKHNKYIGHNKENIRLICYCCNAMGDDSIKTPCVSGCHGNVIIRQKKPRCICNNLRSLCVCRTDKKYYSLRMVQYNII